MKDLKTVIEENVVDESFDYIRNGKVVIEIGKYLDEVIQGRKLAAKALSELLIDMAHDLKSNGNLDSFIKEV